MEVLEKMRNILDRDKYFDYGNMNYEEQNDLFIKFKSIFDELKRHSEEYEYENFPIYLENAVLLAVEGNPVAQDFLTYIYKKGKTNVMQPNVLRAYQWGIIASDNLSMIAIDRLKFFYLPAFDKISQSDKIDCIIEKEGLTSNIIEYFFAANIASSIMLATDLSLEKMMKEEIIPENFSVQEVHELENLRDRVLSGMIEKLYEQAISVDKE